MSINNRLSEFREKLHLKQAQIADSIGIKQSTYSKYEKEGVKIPEYSIFILKLKYDLNDQWLRTGDYYLFSSGFKPGPKYCSSRFFDRYWDRSIRKALKLPMNFKFYSLKYTGITDMIRTHNDPLLARDQARHHDLSITNMYLPPDMMQANEAIKNDSREF